MDVKVNSEQWSRLSKTEQQSLAKIVNSHFMGSSIVPDATTPATELETTVSFIPGFPNPVCKSICDLAQGAAVAACTGIGSPLAVAACVAAAQAAGDACRNNC